MTDEVFAPLTRAYVDHPGNWSALDGRRQVILDLLDRDAENIQGEPSMTATPGVGDDMRAGSGFHPWREQCVEGGEMNPLAANVLKAGVMREVTQQAIDDSAGDIEAMVRADMVRKLEDFAPRDSWVSEPEITETAGLRFVNIYADDADWDADEPPEPIGSEAIPSVNFRAFVYFTKDEK